MPNDPLLQPFQLKHLTLRNRIMITSHEPAYTEDGMPTERYRAYHVERAKAGVALTMTAGSALVARDSPAGLQQHPRLEGRGRRPHAAAHRRLSTTRAAAVMIQLTHLGRRTRWDTGDWLPVVSPSHEREAAHRAFPKRIEDWDIARIVEDYAAAAERMQAAGLDGIELEAYGHLHRPVLVAADQRPRRALWRLARQPHALLLRRASRDPRPMRRRLHRRRALRRRRRPAGRHQPGTRASRSRGACRDSGLIDFLNVIRGHIDTDAGLTDVIPIQGMPSAPHLDFAGEVRAATGFPTFHAARINDVATARHAIASGKLDMVGMTRAHIADPHIVRKIIEGREDDIRPCVGANYCLDRIYQGGAAFCIHNPATGRELEMPHTIVPAPVRAQDHRRRRRTRRARGRARRRRARPRGRPSSRRPTSRAGKFG